jgi:hypothetical protein
MNNAITVQVLVDADFLVVTHEHEVLIAHLQIVWANLIRVVMTMGCGNFGGCLVGHKFTQRVIINYIVNQIVAECCLFTILF